MGTWRSIATPGVRFEELRSLLEDEGSSWAEACHVTATTSLAQAMRSEGKRVALPIATLLDLITMPGHPEGYALPLEGFPGQSQLTQGIDEYRARMRDWQARASGRRLRIAIEMDGVLRRYVNDTVTDAGHRRVLLESRRELTKSIVALASAGVEPGDLHCTDPIAAAAAEAWSLIEHHIPAVSTLRRTLWTDTDDFRAQRTTEARDIAARIRNALEGAFGDVPAHGRRLLVHHGFYFFTPAQWAL